MDSVRRDPDQGDFYFFLIFFTLLLRSLEIWKLEWCLLMVPLWREGGNGVAMTFLPRLLRGIRILVAVENNGSGHACRSTRFEGEVGSCGGQFLG